MNSSFTTAITISGYLSLVIGAVLTLMSKVKNDNLADLLQRVSILEKERDDARKQHVENQKAIANLEGQLSTYKEIPLKSIASSLSELAKSNQKILNRLDNDASIKQKETM